MYKLLLRPLLFRFSADYAHELALKTAETISTKPWLLKSAGLFCNYQHPSLEQKIWGLNFPNPVGLAAGFDKNGTVAPMMESLGFGFVEIGSITALPSTGNPKPRSFRLPGDEAVINRMGLNNDGSRTISRRLRKLDLTVPMGVNIAKTHNPEIMGEAALMDYKTSFDQIKDLADYITLNISCPNTEEGKTFEDPEALDRLLSLLQINRDSSLPPVLVKFSVDLEAALLTELIEVAENHNVSGYVATNTSSQRFNLKTPKPELRSIGRGGLSGRPISNRSTEIIEQISAQTRRDKNIIGVGGVFSAQDAIDKFKAGADLVQIYTSMIYEGPSVVKRINKGLVRYMRSKGLEHIYQIRTSKDQ
jgi:dihydroorotate dehydrogenase